MRHVFVVLSGFVCMLVLATFVSEEAMMFLSAVVSMTFPLANRWLLDTNDVDDKVQRKLAARTRALAVAFVALLTISELLVKGDDKRKHAIQVFICILISNATLFIAPRVLAEPVELEGSVSTEITSHVEEQRQVIEPPSLPPQEPTVQGDGLGGLDKNDDANDMSHVVVPEPVSVALEKIAENGNGEGKPLSSVQLQQVVKLHKEMMDLFSGKFKAANCEDQLYDFCDWEACRRFLVARGWSFSKARAQLSQTLEWRLKDRPGELTMSRIEFNLKNPYAMTLRIVGLDINKRPVVLGTFLHALDRFIVDMNVQYFMVLMEEARRLVTKQFRNGETKFAQDLQWNFIMDFTGFGIRDASPYTTYFAAKLLTYFPELLSRAILVDAPMLFSTAWNMIQPILDDRIRAKISFLPLSKLKDRFSDKLGPEMTNWLYDEIASSRAHKSSMGKREYWTVQPNGHDPRGPKSYVGSRYYVETPGDAWAKMQTMN